MRCPLNQTKSNKKAYFFIISLSFLIIAFLFWLIYFQTGANHSRAWVSYLPFLNASLNFLTSILLILGFREIRRKNVETHVRFMLTAVLCSALFLLSYITYHYFQGDTKFLGEGLLRVVYFFILISHIILSIIQVPLILGTLYFAGTKQFKKHKKIAKITFPIWLYVSVTGVLIFLFLNFLN